MQWGNQRGQTKNSKPKDHLHFPGTTDQLFLSHLLTRTSLDYNMLNSALCRELDTLETLLFCLAVHSVQFQRRIVYVELYYTGNFHSLECWNLFVLVGSIGEQKYETRCLE